MFCVCGPVKASFGVVWVEWSDSAQPQMSCLGPPFLNDLSANLSALSLPSHGPLEKPSHECCVGLSQGSLTHGHYLL